MSTGNLPDPAPVSSTTAPAVVSKTGKSGRSGVLHFSMVELLVALILLFISAPLVDNLRSGQLIESVLMTLVLVASVLAVGGRRRTLAIAVLLMLPAVWARWANHLHPNQPTQEIYLGATLVFMLFVVINLLRFILRAPHVNLEVLCAGIAGYLLMGLSWAFAYMMVAWHVPNSFMLNGTPTTIQQLDQFGLFYFSFVTLTTTGYGDYTPVSQVARMLAVMEAMTGTFYVAILISRLVAMYSRNPPAHAEPQKEK